MTTLHETPQARILQWIFHSPRHLSSPGIELGSPSLAGGLYCPQVTPYHLLSRVTFTTINQKEVVSFRNRPNTWVKFCVWNIY